MKVLKFEKKTRCKYFRVLNRIVIISFLYMMLYLALVIQKANDILLLSQLTFMSNINMKHTVLQIQLGKY